MLGVLVPCPRVLPGANPAKQQMQAGILDSYRLVGPYGRGSILPGASFDSARPQQARSSSW